MTFMIKSKEPKEPKAPIMIKSKEPKGPKAPKGVRRRRFLLACGCVGLTVIAFLATVIPARSQDDLDVLKVIPENYKLILENPFVRVIEARVPPGTVERPHRHLRGVSVCMTEYTIESRMLPDGQWARSERKLWTVYWSEASLHELRNVGKTQSHTIRVELKF